MKEFEVGQYVYLTGTASRYPLSLQKAYEWVRDIISAEVNKQKCVVKKVRASSACIAIWVEREKRHKNLWVSKDNVELASDYLEGAEEV